VRMSGSTMNPSRRYVAKSAGDNMTPPQNPVA
jgi:hypothetical protein